MRSCRKCGVIKPILDFKKHTHGYRHVCKKCQYLAEMNNPIAHSNRNARNKVYRDSERGRAVAQAYSRSTKGRASRYAAIKRYENTPQGAENKYFSTAKRRASRIQRTPAWLTVDDLWMIKEIYSLARLRTQVFGFKWHVDHIIPLQGGTVSGLHVPKNLRVIPWIDNQRKFNKFEGVQ